MHCKNFSLIDRKNGDYVLSPAYDLLAVLLADPADTEEMAMSFIVGGPTDKMIERMKGNLPVWKELISQSFLPEEMKADYCHLLDQRIALL